MKGWSFKLHLLHPRGLDCLPPSPRKLNIEFPSCAGDKLEDLPPVLTLVKIEGLNYLPPFSLWNTEGLGVPLVLFHHTEDRKMLSLCWWPQLVKYWWFWVGPSIVTPCHFQLFPHDVLCEWLLIFMSSSNFHRLGLLHAAKATPWCHNSITLSLYHFFCVIGPIGLCINDVC